MPLWAYDAWVARGVDWLAMSEDLPSADNRVLVDPAGRIRLHYEPNNLRAHARLVRETKRILKRLGFWVVMTHSHKSRNTTHQCGTLVFGTDPRTSVLDTFCRTHDVENLFVVDASFFPSSAAVNPALTIVAQALRVAEHIRATESQTLTRRTDVRARSFSHVGITVSDFNRAVQFYWDVFGCPLVGVADTPPDRVRSFFGIDVPAPTLQDRLDPRARRRRARDLSSSSPQLPAATDSVEPRRPDAHLLRRPRHHKWHAYLKAKGVEVAVPSPSSRRAATGSSSSATSTAT